MNGKERWWSLLNTSNHSIDHFYTSSHYFNHYIIINHSFSSSPFTLFIILSFIFSLSLVFMDQSLSFIHLYHHIISFLIALSFNHHFSSFITLIYHHLLSILSSLPHIPLLISPLPPSSLLIDRLSSNRLIDHSFIRFNHSIYSYSSLCIDGCIVSYR